jgi:hypothetical protein
VQHDRHLAPIMAAGAGLVAAGQSVGRSVEAGGVPFGHLVVGTIMDLLLMPGLLAYGLGLVAVAFTIAWMIMVRDPRPVFALMRNRLLSGHLLAFVVLVVLAGSTESVVAGYVVSGLLVGLLLHASWCQLGLFDPARVGYVVALAFIAGSVVLPWFAMPSMFLPHQGPTGPPGTYWQWLLMLPGVSLQLYEFSFHTRRGTSARLRVPELN